MTPTRSFRAALWTLTLAISLASCGFRKDLPPGDPALLAGEWKFRAEQLGAEPLVGTLSLRAVAATDTTANPPGWAVRPTEGILTGIWAEGSLGWLTTPIQNREVGAVIFDDRSAAITFRISGRCDDCGNIRIRLQVGADSASGEWRQEFVGDPTVGSFMMVRGAPPALAAAE
jgi:hypothetical protein